MRRKSAVASGGRQVGLPESAQADVYPCLAGDGLELTVTGRGGEHGSWGISHQLDGQRVRAWYSAWTDSSLAPPVGAGE
jgi:hypothetical protein